MRLNGKVAVVTGGAKGLGGEMCQLFAKEGAKVVAVDMMPLTYENANVEFYKLNVTSSEDCKEFYDYVIKKYGKVDVLVNNAGITRDAMTRKNDRTKCGTRLFPSTLPGVFNLTRLIGPQMEEIGGGSIINIPPS